MKPPTVTATTEFKIPANGWGSSATTNTVLGLLEEQVERARKRGEDPRRLVFTIGAYVWFGLRADERTALAGISTPFDLARHLGVKRVVVSK